MPQTIEFMRMYAPQCSRNTSQWADPIQDPAQIILRPQPESLQRRHRCGRANRDEGLRVAFERGGQRLFAPSHLGERTTVHALTIHKSQGSQFGEVVVVLPQETSRLLTRELLYIAVTRASGKVTVLGDESVVR
jgi:exodeoxyribonuclease V alpha subunit